LEAYFDRQLANVGSILEESIRIERQVIKLLMKILLILKRYICTSYIINENHHSRKEDDIGEIE